MPDEVQQSQGSSQSPSVAGDDAVKGTLQEVTRKLNHLCDGHYSPDETTEDRLESDTPSTNSSLASSSLFSPDFLIRQNGLIKSKYNFYSMKELTRTKDWQCPAKRSLLPSVTPSGALPPLQRNFSCTSLRTTLRSDRLASERNETTSANLETPGSATFTNKSILPPITTRDARTKSFIVGSISSKGSLLGTEELLRYFPNRTVRIFLGTWNMNGQRAPENLEDFLLPSSVHHLSDIYVIAIQEGLQDSHEWNVEIQTRLGPSHVLFHSVSLGVLHLSVFVRRDLLWFCSIAEDASHSTRPGTMVKTKGAVAICCTIFGTSFLFINSHLTAHARKLRERIVDYEKICQMIDLPKIVPIKRQFAHNKDVSTKFDCAFWCGDLNFRLDNDRSTVIKLVEDVVKNSVATFDYLLEHDQLKKAMSTGVAFHGFQEADITFGPSYKFASGSKEFDSVKQRVPSYTDRILFRNRKQDAVECQKYSMVPEIISSDHKPVFAIFDVQLEPGRDNIPLAAGLFNRAVYLEAMKRRADSLEVNGKGSLVCSLM